ncbi:MAG: delta-60 repeat domain-containing protein, partial [Planctomycetia bacterium]
MTRSRLDADRRKLAVRSPFFIETLEDRSVPAVGLLDPTFSGDGKTVTSLVARSDEARAVAVQADGKIVAVGKAFNGTHNDFAVARYNVDGSLDTTFSGDGKLTIDFGGGQDIAEDVLIQPDGKIIVVGHGPLAGNESFVAYRFNSDGSADTYGFNGRALSSGGQAFGAALDGSGNLVVVGTTSAADQNVRVLRFSPQGFLDTTFGTGGIRDFTSAAGDDVGFDGA